MKQWNGLRSNQRVGPIYCKQQRSILLNWRLLNVHLAVVLSDLLGMGSKVLR